MIGIAKRALGYLLLAAVYFAILRMMIDLFLHRVPS